MLYRAEIDGLRAVAVIPVVLFHAGLTWFNGGYVGVDVFFVISGFLITTIILGDVKKERFSLIRFYERRIRRIIPALYFVVIVTGVFSFLFFTPFELEEFSYSLVSVVVYASNIFFWKNSGYFETQSEFNPLLHTWSLSVEEQFYIFLPLTVLFLWKFSQRILVLVLLTAFFASLFLSHWAAELFPSANFYLLPTRAWELLAGSLLAIHLSSKTHRSTNDFFSVVGFILIFISVITYDEHTPFPSFYALLPVIGTLLIIRYADASSAFGKLLSAKYVVKIGVISYSFYLIHQPIFAFARRFQLGAIELPVMVGLSVVSGVLAFFTWKFVEVPFRNRNVFGARQILISFLLSSCFLLGVGAWGVSSDGLISHKTDPFQREVLASVDSSPKREVCHTGGRDYLRPSNACSFGGDNVTWALVGDSHGVELAYALGRRLEVYGLGIEQFTFSGCVPKYGSPDDSTPCQRWTNEVVSHVLGDNNISHVVIIYRINSALFGPHELSYPEIPDEFSEEVTRKRWEAYKLLVKEISKQKEVTLVLQPPELPRHVSILIGRNEVSGGSVRGVSRDWWEKRSAYVYDRMDEITSGSNNVEVIDPAELFCGVISCYAVLDGQALYFDDDHISLLGADKIIDAILAEKKFLEK